MCGPWRLDEIFRQSTLLLLKKVIPCVSPFALLTSVWLSHRSTLTPNHIWIKLLMRKQGTEIKLSRLHRKSGSRLGSHFQQPIQKSHLNSLSEVLEGQSLPKQVSDERKYKLVCPFEENTHRDTHPHTCKDLTFNFDPLHCLSLDFNSSVFKTISTGFKWAQYKLLNLNYIFS